MEIRVVAPDPAWTSMYEGEAARIRASLGNTVIELHHIGSTAIRGIYAKPVIDILLVVADLTELDLHADRMVKLEYESKGEFGIPGRRYFRKNSSRGVRTHQVHSFERESHGALRHLAFRDYMNCHPDAAQAYSSLKQKLAAQFSHDIQEYMDGKSSFIQQHEKLALSWFSGAHGA